MSCLFQKWAKWKLLRQQNKELKKELLDKNNKTQIHAWMISVWIYQIATLKCPDYKIIVLRNGSWENQQCAKHIVEWKKL